MELIPIYFIIRAFIEKAEEKNFDKTKWAIIGVVSYVVAVVLFAFVGVPFLRSEGFFDFPGKFETYVIIAIANGVTGLLVMTVVYQVLGGMKPNRKNPWFNKNNEGNAKV